MSGFPSSLIQNPVVPTLFFELLLVDDDYSPDGIRSLVFGTVTRVCAYTRYTTLSHIHANFMTPTT